MLGGFFFISLLAVSASYAGDDKARDFNFDFYYTYLGCTVNNMPLEIRDVPVHSDDSWSDAGQGPIDQLKYNCNHSVVFSFMYANEFGAIGGKQDRFNFGIGLDWMAFPWLGVGADKAERNYMGNPGSTYRGYGTALTYVGLTQDGIIPQSSSPFLNIFLNWTPRVKLEVAPFSGSLENLWLGTSVSYYTFDAQTGWDRYDTLEERKSYTLAYEFPIRVYATLFSDNKRDGGFTIGAQFQQGSKTSLGRQADMSIAPVAFFVGFSSR
jgi:hypothetical protein